MDGAIHRLVPSWQPSLHSAVTFSEMPYHEAMARCEDQDRVLLLAATAATTAVVGVLLIGLRAACSARR